MLNQWQIAGGSVIGKDHVRAGKNNQDAYCWSANEQALVAIVTDGCGSSPYSEVGAQLGARFLSKTLLDMASSEEDWVSMKGIFFKHMDSDRVGEIFTDFRNTSLEYFGQLAKSIGKDFKTVEELLLFSVVGCLIRRNETIIFSMGDGVYGSNERFSTIQPNEGNKPSYLAYGLYDDAQLKDNEKNLKQDFHLHVVSFSTEIQSVLIGSDGLQIFQDQPQTKVPGKDEVIGGLEQFVLDDKYFKNPDAIRRRLNILNKENRQIDWKQRTQETEHGLLNDDATLIAIRRKQ
jgi:hypothetical protein